MLRWVCGLHQELKEGTVHRNQETRVGLSSKAWKVTCTLGEEGLARRETLERSQFGPEGFPSSGNYTTGGPRNRMCLGRNAKKPVGRSFKYYMGEENLYHSEKKAGPDKFRGEK